jgi:catechol 2,3-dioxygenase-like lactoylglutathione lyase family enzyme
MSMAVPGLELGTIGQIALTVQDLPRAVAFYRDALGLRALPIEAPRLAFFDCGGIRLMLSLPEAVDSRPGGAALYFRVADIQRAYEALTSRGVPFIGAPHQVARLSDHDLWLAAFRDPDGNLLALMAEVPR